MTNKKRSLVRVSWLSPLKYPVGFKFTNIFGREIGEVTSCESLGGQYSRVQADLNEDLPLEVILRSKSPSMNKEIKNE